MDASRGRSRKRKIKGFAGRFVLRQSVAVAGQIVAAVDRWFLKRARAEQGGFSFEETVAGNPRQAEKTPGLGVGWGLRNGADKLGFGFGGAPVGQEQLAPFQRRLGGHEADGEEERQEQPSHGPHLIAVGP